MPPYLVHLRYRQCFQAFSDTFHAQTCCDFFLSPNSLKSWLGGLARYKTASPNRELVCPKGSRKSADPPVRVRIGEHPPSNQSLTSASQGFCRNLPGKRNGPRGSRIGHHRLRSSRYTHGPWSQTHPQNPEAPRFRNPRQLSTFTDSCAEPEIPSNDARHVGAIVQDDGLAVEGNYAAGMRHARRRSEKSRTARHQPDFETQIVSQNRRPRAASRQTTSK